MQMKRSVGRILIQAALFLRDAATRQVHVQVCGRIRTEGTVRDPALPRHCECGHILMDQPSSDTRRRSGAPCI